ncbi:hypothetical protein [Candidatus Uabimicrobium sp. HlEnr_7]|uniref:hypothetical protein n=1 Tax=Candidatus Uabimicrobium helgolandensis TaxID=3095367 RepID=UPI0035587D9C
MKIFILIIFVISTLIHTSAQKEYDLIWRIRKGLVNVMPEKNIIETQTFVVNGDNETLTETQKTSLVSTIYWTTENIIGKDKVSIRIMVEGKKLKIKKNDITYQYKPHKPWEEQSEIFLPYKKRMGYGVVVLLDVAKQDVLVTWDLKKQDNGTYKREMYRGARDPYYISSSYKQLINKRVPIGAKWQTERLTTNGFTYKYNYTFSQIKKYRGEPVAKVDIEGSVLLNNINIGTIKGYFLHDYKVRLMRYYKLHTITESRYTKDKKKYLQTMSLKTEWKLTKTNASEE